MTNKMTKIQYNLYDVIRYPLVTEKATHLSNFSQVAFAVCKESTKQQVKDAVELVYGVKVLTVNTLNQKGKQKRFKGRLGVRGDVKKAIVTLQQDQNIDISSGI
jgi:large subunit ribosomal protein L23